MAQTCTVAAVVPRECEAGNPVHDQTTEVFMAIHWRHEHGDRTARRHGGQDIASIPDTRPTAPFLPDLLNRHHLLSDHLVHWYAAPVGT